MADLAALVSPGNFKARKKEPERMLADFELYIKSMKDFLIVTQQNEASDAVKKSMLRAVGGPDMVWLCDHIGKVTEGMTYEQAVGAIRRSITGQTNQSAMRFKLFTGMQQGSESFSNWWTKITEQADKCDWTGYDSKKAAKDAIIFQTANKKLRKKALAEDSNLEEVVQQGLALEQTEKNSEAMGKKRN